MMNDREKKAVEEATHDIDELNKILKESVSYITNQLGLTNIDNGKPFVRSANEIRKVREHAESILFTSILTKHKLDFLAVELDEHGENTDLIHKSIRDFDLHGLFHRTKLALKSKADAKDVDIRINKELLNTGMGDSKNTPFKCIELIEMLPFLFLENAVKYSNKGGDIEVEIIEYENTYTVKICSYGVCLSESELNQVTKRGYRGERASMICNQGRGIGLYTADVICKLAGSVSFTLDTGTASQNLYEGFPSSTFTVNIDITK